MTPPYRERVVRFGPREGLAGILGTRREAIAAALPHVVIVNAGIIHRVGPSRLYVDMARAMVERGYPTLRFDLAGLGDSESMTGGMSLEASALQDITAAFDYLAATRGAKTFLVVGLCSGANYATLATFSDPRVVGALLVDPTVARTWQNRVVHLARRLQHLATLSALLTFRHPVYQRPLNLMRNVSVAPSASGQRAARVDVTVALVRASVASVEGIIARGVQLMLVFTGGVNHVYNYERQLYDLLPGLDFRNQLRLLYLPHTDHTVGDAAGRRRLLASVGEWLDQAFGAAVQRGGDEPVLSVEARA